MKMIEDDPDLPTDIVIENAPRNGSDLPPLMNASEALDLPPLMAIDDEVHTVGAASSDAHVAPPTSDADLLPPLPPPAQPRLGKSHCRSNCGKPSMHLPTTALA